MQTPFETAWLILKESHEPPSGHQSWWDADIAAEKAEKKQKRIHLIKVAPEWVYANLLDYLEPDEIEHFEELHGRIEELPDDRRHPDSNKNATFMESIGESMPSDKVFTPPGTGMTEREEVPALIEPTQVGVLGAAEDPAEEEEIPPTNNNVKVQRND